MADASGDKNAELSCLKKKKKKNIQIKLVFDVGILGVIIRKCHGHGR